MRLNLRVLAVAVAVSLALLGAIQLANPVELGISPVAVKWLGILSTGLGVLATFLPRVQGMTAAQLANRIMELTPAERLDLQEEVERQHQVEPGRG